MVDLARYGMAAKATALRRHGPSHRLATLLATVAYLEAKSIDACLELLDLLMVTDLLGKAERETARERARRRPGLARYPAALAAVVEVLSEVTEYGEEISLEQVWESIEAIVSRPELRAAVAAVTDMVPPPGADARPAGGRTATVPGFLKDTHHGDRVRRERRRGGGAGGDDGAAAAAGRP
jgi:hypothetical protein